MPPLRLGFQAEDGHPFLLLAAVPYSSQRHPATAAPGGWFHGPARRPLQVFPMQVRNLIYWSGVMVIVIWMCAAWLVVSALAWLAGERQ